MPETRQQKPSKFLHRTFIFGCLSLHTLISGRHWHRHCHYWPHTHTVSPIHTRDAINLKKVNCRTYFVSFRYHKLAPETAAPATQTQTQTHSAKKTKTYPVQEINRQGAQNQYEDANLNGRAFLYFSVSSFYIYALFSYPPNHLLLLSKPTLALKQLWVNILLFGRRKDNWIGNR